MGQTVVIGSVAYVVEMLIAVSYFNRIFERKRKSGYVFLAGAALYFCGFLFYVFINHEIVNTVDFCLINLLFMLICYKCSLKEAVIQVIITTVFMLTSEVVIIYLISSAFKIPVAFYKDDLSASVLLILLSKLLYFLLLQLISLIITHNKYKNIYSRRYVPLFIFPVLTIATMILFLLISADYQFSKPVKITIAVLSGAFIIACIMIFIYYQYLADNEAKVNELESERRFYELNNTYLDVLQHQNEELQMLFHDTKHHYLALSGLEDISQVKAYIRKIYPDLENKNTVQISSNKMLDLILNQYIVVCKKKGIRFFYEVKTANLDYIEDSELSILLNNILDNAVEAAAKSQEKMIEFSLRNIHAMDILSVINSCDTPPVHKSGRLITTKSNSEKHGFGTRIIEKHVKRNHGRSEWFYDEAEHRFHFSVLFQKRT